MDLEKLYYILLALFLGNGNYCLSPPNTWCILPREREEVIPITYLNDSENWMSTGTFQSQKKILMGMHC